MVKKVIGNRISDLIRRKFSLDDLWYRLIIKMLSSVISEFDGKKILEVGCGFGGFCVYMAGAGADVIGLDISSKAIHKTKNLVKQIEFKGQVDFVIADAQCLPFKDHANEIVVCSETLEHVPDYERAFSELVRVTSKLGYVCLTVPNLLSTLFYEYIVLILIGQPQYVKNELCLEKEHIFHIFKLRKLLNKEKIQIITIRSTDFLHFPPRVREALKISDPLKVISHNIEDHLETHDLPLKYLGANIGVLVRKE